jgi:AI-2 transport protein TqsA
MFADGFSRIPRLLLISACVVVVIAGMRAIAEPLSAFLLAALIAMLCAPLRTYLMTKRRLSPGISLTAVVALIIGVVILLVGFIAVSTNQLIRRLPNYQEQVLRLETTITTELTRLGLFEQTVEAIESFDVQSLYPVVSGALRAIGDSLGNVLLIVLILLYMLIDAPNLPGRLKGVLDPESPWLDKSFAFVTAVQRYMILRTVFGIIIAVIQTVLMLIMGVDFALQWGVLSVITNYIPNIGFVLGLIPPVAVTLLEQGPVPALVLLVLYSVINNIVENFVAPRFMAEDLGISSLFIFLSLIFWTWVLGAAGALLAVPLTLFVKIMLLEGDDGAKTLLAFIREGPK